MTITKNAEESKLVLELEGRLDTTTAPELEAVINDELAAVTELVIDMKDLEYISSAGLRVLLKGQKIMNKKNGMIIKHVNDTINEVFEVTGFLDVLTIED